MFPRRRRRRSICRLAAACVLEGALLSEDTLRTAESTANMQRILIAAVLLHCVTAFNPTTNRVALSTSYRRARAVAPDLSRYPSS